MKIACDVHCIAFLASLRYYSEKFKNMLKRKTNKHRKHILKIYKQKTTLIKQVGQLMRLTFYCFILFFFLLSLVFVIK